MKTTAQVARLLGVHRVTLQRWIASGKVRPPRLLKLNGGAIRLWTATDIRRARRQLKPGRR